MGAADDAPLFKTIKNKYMVDVKKIIKDVRHAGEQCLAEIKKIVSQKEGQSIDVDDCDKDRLYAVICDEVDGITEEYFIIKLWMKNGKLMLTTDEGWYTSEDQVVYGGAVWPDMLECLLGYV